ncbi:hypothetical protein CLOL250_00347 [Clostridium sp. L2-50]|nr:hypothetical protein CLOL250_00347 [Clostridium sp. L2-50]
MIRCFSIYVKYMFMRIPSVYFLLYISFCKFSSVLSDLFYN